MNATSRAWLVVGLLFPVALLNYLDRQMLATMRLSSKADFAEQQGAPCYGRTLRRNDLARGLSMI